MAKLNVLENRTLKLLNVFTKELKGIQVTEVDKEIQKFINFLELSKIQTRGPLITKNSGTQIHENGEITVDYYIMIQTIREINPHNGYSFQEMIKVENCLYVRFDGKSEDLTYAHSKLNLHLWENDLITTGEEYTIYIEHDNEWLKVDIFKPVVI